MTDNAKKAVNGSAFVADLDKCETPKEIFTLLSKTMDKETLKDRALHVHDNSLVVALHAQVARHNSQLNLRTAHQDCLNMAADRYCKVTGKDIKYFKAELNKHITKEKEVNKDNIIFMQMASKRARA